MIYIARRLREGNGRKNKLPPISRRISNDNARLDARCGIYLAAWADFRESADETFGCVGAMVPAASTLLAAIRSQRQRTQRMATVYTKWA